MTETLNNILPKFPDGTKFIDNTGKVWILKGDTIRCEKHSLYINKTYWEYAVIKGLKPYVQMVKKTITQIVTVDEKGIIQHLYSACNFAERDIKNNPLWQIVELTGEYEVPEQISEPEPSPGWFEEKSTCTSRHDVKSNLKLVDGHYVCRECGEPVRYQENKRRMVECPRCKLKQSIAPVNPQLCDGCDWEIDHD